MGDSARVRSSRLGHAGIYGSDRFGRGAEWFVRLFGKPRFLVAQTIIIIGWLIVNTAGIGPRFDPYPFIFLNLVFSALAAYAAPLILLAETRQADRDKMQAEAEARHRAEAEARLSALLEHDVGQTEAIAQLAEENRLQTAQISELLQEAQQLLERESEQTALIVSALLPGGKASAEGLRSRAEATAARLEAIAPEPRSSQQGRP